jgi:hypothetical protein
LSSTTTAEPYCSSGAAPAPIARDVNAASESAELTQLRARVDGLVQRRLAALERLSPVAASPSRHQLEAMRIELSELQWQLADLEALIRA